MPRNKPGTRELNMIIELQRRKAKLYDRQVELLKRIEKRNPELYEQLSSTLELPIEQALANKLDQIEV
jgi:hypothetical protein